MLVLRAPTTLNLSVYTKKFKQYTSSTTIFLLFARLHVSTFLIGHHQALLNYESIDVIYVLRSQHVYIGKIRRLHKLM